MIEDTTIFKSNGKQDYILTMKQEWIISHELAVTQEKDLSQST